MIKTVTDRYLIWFKLSGVLALMFGLIGSHWYAYERGNTHGANAVLAKTQETTIAALAKRNTENAALIKQQAEDAKKASQDHEHEKQDIRRRAAADARRRVPIDRASFCGTAGTTEASQAGRDEQADTGAAFLPEPFASDLRQLAADADEVAADLRTLKARAEGCFE